MVVAAAVVVDAEVVQEDAIAFGGVDSDEYESLNDTVNASGLPSHGNALGDDDILHGADRASIAQSHVLEAQASHVDSDSSSENEGMDETPTDFAATAQLLTQFSHAFLEKRDVDPSHVHPAAVGYRHTWSAQDGQVTSLRGEPQLATPVFFGGYWYARQYASCVLILKLCSGRKKGR